MDGKRDVNRERRQRQQVGVGRLAGSLLSMVGVKSFDLSGDGSSEIQPVRNPPKTHDGTQPSGRWVRKRFFGDPARIKYRPEIEGEAVEDILERQVGEAAVGPIFAPRISDDERAFLVFKLLLSPV